MTPETSLGQMIRRVGCLIATFELLSTAWNFCNLPFK